MNFPNLDVETKLWEKAYTKIVGVDEVGRGCLSGPVVAAAVLLPAYCQPISGVRDSKKLSLRQRESLYKAIKQQAVEITLGAASAAEIDQLNILNATYLAMRRALQRITVYDHALIDGKTSEKAQLGQHTAIIDGDYLCYSIACASIVAKVVRDCLMQQLAKRYPGYHWESNVGYGTKAHLHALAQLGLTPLHRRSFAPVKRLLINV